MCSCRFALKQAQIAEVGRACPAGEHRKKRKAGKCREKQRFSYCSAPALPPQLHCHNSELVSSTPVAYISKRLGEMFGSPIRGQQVTSSKGPSLVLKTLETRATFLPALKGYNPDPSCPHGRQQTHSVQITFGTPTILTYEQRKNAFLSPLHLTSPCPWYREV